MAIYWENSCSFGLRYVSWYKCLIVSLVFSHLGFWSGNLFLIAPFPELCLLVPFYCQSHASQPPTCIFLIAMVSAIWIVSLDLSMGAVFHATETTLFYRVPGVDSGFYSFPENFEPSVPKRRLVFKIFTWGL